MLSGDGGWQVRDIDVEENGCQHRPCGMPFLRRRNLLLLPFLVERVKQRLPTISMSMRIMCLSGSDNVTRVNNSTRVTIFGDSDSS